MDTKRMKSLLDNETISNTFFNLYERWSDESQYEDINDYEKVLAKVIRENGFPISREKATKRPFGLKFMLDGQCWHTCVKLKGQYLAIYAKPIPEYPNPKIK